MKKSVSVILIVLLLASLFVTAAAEDTPQVTLTASSSKIKAGDTVTLTLALSGELTGISSFEYYVHYNPQVVDFKSGVKGESSTLVVVGTPPDANYEKTATDQAITVSAVDLANGTFNMTAGTVATLEFTAKQDALSGADCDLVLDEVAVCDSTFADNAVSINTAAAQDVKVMNDGDVNGVDGIDVGDVQHIYAFNHGKISELENSSRADVNGDGKVDISFITELFNKILSAFKTSEASE